MDLLRKICYSPIIYNRNKEEEARPILRYNIAAPTPSNIKGVIIPISTSIPIKNTYPAPTPSVAKLPYHTSMSE